MRRTLIVLAGAVLFAAACSSAALPTSNPDLEKPGTGVGFPGATAGASAPSGPSDQVAGQVQQQLIVRVGDIELQVSDVTAVYRQARELALRLGGYVGDSQFATDSNGRPSATVVLRIPADRYDDALDALRPMATKVVSERSQETDVTSQVVDLNARIANLRSTEAALQKLMDQATKVSDVLDVEHELSAVREQIEQLTAQQQLLQKQAALSTLTVTLETLPQPVSEVANTWDPGAEFQRAVAALVDIAQGLGRLAIWVVVVVLPVALGAGFVFLVAWFLARRLRPRTVRFAVSDGPPVPPPPADPGENA
jgi:hypothetical protein